MKTITFKISNFLFIFLTLFTISNDASSYLPVIINSNEIESRFTTTKTENQYKLSLTLSSLNAPYPNFIFVALVLILAPIPVYFFIKWIFGGFKKDKK